MRLYICLSLHGSALTFLGHSRTNGWFNFSQKQLEMVFRVMCLHRYEVVNDAAALDESSSSYFSFGFIVMSSHVLSVRSLEALEQNDLPSASRWWTVRKH